jgi:hypothetical protein
VAGDEAGQKVTKTGLVVGTPEYMSPEQLSGDKLDGRSDIYSLGLVFYRMLTGVLPFQADSAQETMIKRLTDAPMPLAAARPDIAFPPGLQPVLDKALARTPSERYAAATDFARDAEAAVGGAAVPGTRVAEPVTTAATQLMDAEHALKAHRANVAPTTARPPVPAKKFPLVPVLGGVVGVGAIAVVAMMTMSRTPKTPAAQAPVDTSKAAAPGNQSAANTTPPGGAPANPAASGGRSLATGKEPVRPANTTTRGPAAPAVNLQDSLDHGVRLLDQGDSVGARRTLMFVWNAADASKDQKGEAAFNIAAAYGADRDNVIRWLRQSDAMGFSAAAGALRTLGVGP